MNGIEVGKEVICIKTHSRGVVEKNEIYMVNAIKRDCCGGFVLDVGIQDPRRSPTGYIRCTFCNTRMIQDYIWWIDIELFAPLADISELEKLLKENIYENSENNTTG